MADDDSTRDSGTNKPSRPSASAARPKVVPLPVKRTVSTAHREHLRTSGLSDETIELAALYTESHSATIATILNWRSWPRSRGAVIVFPFFEPSKDEPSFYRARPDNPRTIPSKDGSSVKVIKYEQPKEVPVAPYLPPRTRTTTLLRDATAPLYWTEGEKKALLLDQLGYATIGLAGVWNAHDVTARDQHGIFRLHPTLQEHVAVAGRVHVIVFDSDAAENDHVMTAARRLAGMLIAGGAARVLLVRIPSRPDGGKLGIDDYFVLHSEEATRALLSSHEPIEPLPPEEPFELLSRVRALVRAPIADNLRMPDGYEIDRRGQLWAKAKTAEGHDELIESSVVVLKRMLSDLYTHEHRVEVAFRRAGEWVSATIDGSSLADPRQLVAELATYRAPIDSGTSLDVVRWLRALERVNDQIIERVSSVGSCGWHELNGKRAFVIGTEPVVPEAPACLSIVFDGRGRSGIAKALHSHGDVDTHVAALRRAWKANRSVAALIAASLAAPLLKPLAAPNFVFHLQGDSSRGKTSALKIAASVYGDPCAEAWVSPWNSTLVGMEMRASALCDLPLCYDESGTVDPKALEQSVYMLSNGTGRTRGAKTGGTRETQSWRSIVLSTGERPLVDERSPTGAKTRCVQIDLDGFGAMGASEVTELRSLCEHHYGEVGRTWIGSLVDVDDWAPIRKGYRDTVRELQKSAPNSLAARQAGFFGLLVVAEKLANDILGIGDPDGATMRAFSEPDDQSRQEILPAADRALDLVRDLRSSQPGAFRKLIVHPVSNETIPEGADRGIELVGYLNDEAVWFIATALRQYLDPHGISSDVIAKQWRKRGWLLTDGAGHHTKRLSVSGTRSRFVALRRAVFDGEEDSS